MLNFGSLQITCESFCNEYKQKDEYSIRERIKNPAEHFKILVADSVETVQCKVDRQKFQCKCLEKSVK